MLFVGLLIVGTILGAATFQRYAHWCFLSACGATIVVGLLPLREAVTHSGNSTVLAIALLYIVAAGVRSTGALDSFLEVVLRRPNCRRFLPWVTAVSSVVNNTPVVSVLIHPIQQWCRERGCSSSGLLLPLSYAASLGGMLTLFGTSTNLVVNGLLVEAGYRPLGVFEVAKIGLPCALIGLTFLVLGSGRILSPREDTSALENLSIQSTEKAAIALSLVVAMVLLTALGVLPLLLSAGLTAALMLLTGCCGLKEALRSVDGSVLILLWSALGLAKAAQLAGFHSALLSGSSILERASTPVVLFGLYLTTWLLTEFLTNAAAAALIFPVVVTVAEMQQLDVVPLALLSMVAASSSFITPYGNQTNLMVQRPGGYLATDYFLLGLPLSALIGTTAILTTWFWL